jgi:hypothetical protein
VTAGFDECVRPAIGLRARHDIVFPFERREILVTAAQIGLLSLAVAFVASAVSAQSDLFVYPKEGQDKDQQEKDEFECYRWAKSQSGVDPSAPAREPDRGRRAGSTLGGAAKGAAAGAAIGAIAGDAGKGAAIGAAGGGMMGRRGAKNQERYEQAADRNSYNRAFAACMDARGYTVK